jgi:nicotinamidase-related amidase
VVTALILVDLQSGAFGGLGIPAVHGADRLERNAGALLQAARAAGTPIVHIQHCARAGEIFAEGAPGWPIFPPLAPRTRELVIRKRVSDAFEGTDLEVQLQQLGARRLIVAGIQTEHCVAATCRAALRRGYTVHLATDAHGTWPDEGQSADEIMVRESAALGAAGVTLQSTDDLVVSLRHAGPADAR